jgi:hypothetical protein
MASAALDAGRYIISPPVQVLDAAVLVPTTVSTAGGRRVVIGFDFPIGLPRAYAFRAGIDRFMDALPTFGSGAWAQFYELAESASEISLGRPFYPRRPGGSAREHLVEGLGVGSTADLLRECERATATRGIACPLFWTLGGNQVGRAAIAGWREVLVPALGTLGNRLGIWPFDGDLADLLESRECVIAETYPAQACVQLGLSAPGRGWSKRNREDRVKQGSHLLEWTRSKPIDIGTVASAVADGFGTASTGEDQFDAVIGLLGMLDVMLGGTKEGFPTDEPTRIVEGWIFGQSRDSGPRLSPG